jgi:hypothetical protein
MKTKRNILRSLLLLHFIGLAMVIGTRIANFAIDKQTTGGTLQLLVVGRDLGGAIARGVVLPGFLLVIFTGIVMTLVRYGRRPPVWIWMKVGLTSVALFVASPLVAPALRSARSWAHWSLEHNQLAPQFAASAATASFYGAVVFTLVLLNLPVAIWKPFLSINLYRERRSVDAALGEDSKPVKGAPINQ